ncbi:DUF3841 domain-containing protein [Tessaracoccus sp.]
MTRSGPQPQKDANTVGVLLAWDDLPVRALEDVLRLWPEPDLAGTVDKDEVLLLAAVIPQAAWAELRFGNELGQTWDRVDPSRLGAYQWMSAQMAARTGCAPGRAPVWLWARAGAKTLIDEITWDPADSVLLTVAIPSGRVALSSHEGWHYVLNKSWCPAPTPDGPAEQVGSWPELLSFEDLPAQAQLRVETSWRWVLVPELWSPSTPVQAVTSWVSAAEVVSASRFRL